MFFYEDVFRALNKAKVKYVVFGGLATILHGVHRMTTDMDIIILMTPNNIEKVFTTFDHMGYRPRVPVTVQEFKEPKNRNSWYKNKNMKVFSFVHITDPLKIIDVAIEELVKYKDVKKTYKMAGRLRIPVVSIEDLVKLKKKAGRTLDLIDIDDLKRLGKVKK